MRIDGILLQEGSSIENLSVAVGTSFPTSPNEGEVFFRSDVDTEVKGLYIYSDGAWGRLVTNLNNVGGPGTVTTVSVTTANGISGSVATDTTTPAISLTLGAITPASVAASGSVTGSNLTGTHTGTSTGTNTGDQTITLSGDVTGSGTGTFAATLANTAVAPGVYTNSNITVDSKGRITAASNGSGSGAITLTGDATGTGSGTFAVTLATVNGAPQTDAFRKLTFNGKGLVTASSAVTEGDITSALTYTPLDKAGDTMSGSLTMPTGTSITLTDAPATGTDAVNKNYVDSVGGGLFWKDSVLVATTVNITLSGEQTIDGVLTSSSRVLVKNQTSSPANGIYITAAGAWTRSTDANSVAEFQSASVFVESGTTNADTGWTQIETLSSVGGSPQTWVQFTGANTYIAGTGLTLTGNTFSLTSPVTGARGGTGQTTYAVGDLLYANSATTLTKLAAGATNFALLSSGPSSAPFWGTPQSPANTLTGTTLATNVVNSSLTTVGTLANGTWNANTVTAPYGGTGHAVYVIGDVLYANTSTSLARLPIGAASLVLTSNGGGQPPSWQASAAAAGALTGTTLASNVIYSVLQRVGTIDTGVWQGTSVAANYGGTGQVVYAIGDLLYASGTLALSRLAAGTAGNVLVTNGAGQAPSWGGVPAGTLTGTTLASNVVSSSLTTFGTITAGVWNGTAIAANRGGTGQTGYTIGDILYAGTSSTLTRLPAGTNNYVLTSNGASTAPSWQIATSATLANATVLGDTAGAVSLTGISAASSPMTITPGAATTPNSLTVTGAAASGGNDGGNLILKSGTATALGADAGTILMHADGGAARGGTITIRAGDSAGPGTFGTAGSLSLSAGSNTATPTGGIPGNVTISAGSALVTQPGGSVTISAGTSAAGGGALIFNTGATSSLVERFRILNNGAWSVGTGGAAYGTSGQVLTSNGNAAPTWQAAAGGAASTLTGTTLAANVVSSSLTSVGTITSGTWTGTAIAAANGGTGQTAYAIGDLLYASSSSALSKLAASTSGLVLTSNGAGVAPSWQAAAGGAAGSLTGTTLASNVVSSSLTSVGTLGSLAVSGNSIFTGNTSFRFDFGGTITTLASPNVQIGVSSARPMALFVSADAAANNRVSYLRTTGGTVEFGFFNDAVGTEANWLSTTRSGNTATLITLTSTGVNLAVGTAGLQINGTAGTSGQVLTSNGASLAPTWQAAAGGAAAAGTLTGTTLAANVVSSSLTSVGTITSGTWTGTAIAAINGGTAQTTYATGDLLYASAANTLAKRTIGSTGQVLTVVGGVPTWGAAGTGTVTSVAASVPAFLSVSGSPVTTSGTLAITLSGTALPVANGGTGATTLTLNNVILGNGTSAPTFVAPGTSGNVLTSNGTTWTSAAGGVAAAGTLTGTTLAANVVSSSLTSVGTLGSLTVTGTTTLNGRMQTFGAIASSVAASNVQTCVNLSRPSVLLTNNFLTADERTAYMRVPNTSGVAFGFHNDANTTEADWLAVARSGITATSATITATTVAMTATTTTVSGVLRPTGNGTQTLGASANRWSEVFAATATINTSDENQKEQITSLSLAELAVATAVKPLLKKFKYKDAVIQKGTGARWHVGIIAQDLAAAFAAQGLDADHYGMFCSDTWYELNGEIVPDYTVGATEITQLGVRYEELLAFIISAM